MKGIYTYYQDYGRSGELSGIFVADSEDIAKLVGKDIYFGEILGKHSEVTARIGEGDIELKVEDQDFIARFEAIFGENYESGVNPLSYYDPDRYEEDEEDEE